MTNRRENNFPIAPVFTERWSPRSFDKDHRISNEDIGSLFEAARWAPSSLNEQPWQFVIAKKGDSHFDDFISLLGEFNQKWAKDASLIGFIIAHKEFNKNGQTNECAQFDCGSAWMSLSIQARKLGLYTHGMAGIKKANIYQKLIIPPDQYELICGFAVGKKASPHQLDDDLQEQEKPNSRQKISKFVRWGNFEGDNFHLDNDQ